jgi:hypothetical protein
MKKKNNYKKNMKNRIKEIKLDIIMNKIILKISKKVK